MRFMPVCVRAYGLAFKLCVCMCVCVCVERKELEQRKYMLTMFSYGAVYARKREQYMMWVSSYSLTRQKKKQKKTTNKQKKNQNQQLVNTEFISEKLLKISTREGNKINHYIQVYVPCNDSYSDRDKDSFFEKLSDTINNIK